MIYLDNNATTRPSDQVLEAMRPYYTEFYGNAHSIHPLGLRAHEGVETARAEVARLFGSDPHEVRFTSCGTESNALVVLGLLGGDPARRKIVTTAVEHPSVLSLFRALESKGEISLAVCGVDGDGRLDLAAMAREIDESTLLVSAMLAQNETGVIMPVEEVAAMARAHGALMHVDAVQAAGKLPIDVRAMGADFLTISGHKLHAPKGVGALYIRSGLRMTPLWYGGGQEYGLRSGTEPVPSIVGLGVAARQSLDTFALHAMIQEQRDRFEREIGELFGTEVRISGRAASRLPNTSHLTFRGLAATEIVTTLGQQGICISAGAACHSGKNAASAVMNAMGIPLEYSLGAVRVSLSRYTTPSEIDGALAAFASLRKAHPMLSV